MRSTYDAIVVGSGISGGWAAKELTEKGSGSLSGLRGYFMPEDDHSTIYVYDVEVK